MEIICFHNPDEENGYLSNWFHSDFSIDEIEFSSMEQYMMERDRLLCTRDFWQNFLRIIHLKRC